MTDKDVVNRYIGSNNSLTAINPEDVHNNQLNNSI
jgi:hypothetical protein